MKLTFNFIGRNFKEMIRDPLIYIFTLGCPLLMLSLFMLINHFTDGNTPVFSPLSLVPGVMLFSFTFVMLLVSLLVSKDKKTAFLSRLYISPMKIHDYLLGYLVPSFIIGVLQAIICVLFGYIISLIAKDTYFTFVESILLILSQLPMLIAIIFFGIFIGSSLNDKSAPGVTSVIITISGVLGGAWMPLDVMGGFETFCRVLPFYPSVYLGRIITKAIHSTGEVYVFDNIAKLGFIPILIFFILSIILGTLTFRYQMKKDNK